MLQRNARVTAIRRVWGRAQEVTVKITAAPPGAASFLPGEVVRGLVLVDLVGSVDEGDEVRIDCSALDKNLGTGGYATVLATATLPADNVVKNGHIVKARYMPHQHIVQSVEEPDSEYHEVLANAGSLDSVPVIAADLHSSVPAVVAGIRSVQPDARIVYVWDDTAALPLAFSMAVSKMKENSELTATITSGQSFGGDLEAASMPSALLAARHVAHADYIVVAQGPGNLGTATKWGFSGTAVAQVLHVAHALGGTPLPVVRASQADPRAEHRGISHHSLSVLNDLVLIPLRVAVPTLSALALPRGVEASFEHDVSALQLRHEVDTVDGQACLDALEKTTVPLRTMGRSASEDGLAFAVASAVGIFAAKLKS